MLIDIATTSRATVERTSRNLCRRTNLATGYVWLIKESRAGRYLIKDGALIIPDDVAPEAESENCVGYRTRPDLGFAWVSSNHAAVFATPSIPWIKGRFRLTGIRPTGVQTNVYLSILMGHGVDWKEANKIPDYIKTEWLQFLEIY